MNKQLTSLFHVFVQEILTSVDDDDSVFNHLCISDARRRNAERRLYIKRPQTAALCRLLICQEGHEKSCFSWTCQTVPQGRTGGGTAGQTTNASAPPCCVNAAKQKHKAAAGTL
ncbi:hypothetical protein JOB18_017378 [Solea senegalensis]|uniref:Uncharacterized protein n=1 Tax=Solea senegalensis TaxID=28829 RepID=A0AAV6RV73_SOLSE|nr:hypothetical protein JOB18_027357 [Solea senegalensis]KAG7508573.1 hypothetical protein JOB18_017378 [Solea senegalensis]